jgi:hypothetical protein
VNSTNSADSILLSNAVLDSLDEHSGYVVFLEYLGHHVLPTSLPAIISYDSI